MKTNLYSLIGLFLLSCIFISCKRCETRYEPDFTADELSWVNIENVNPTYQIRYKDGAIWNTDTIIANHIKSEITYSSYTEDDCEDNVRFQTANIEYCIQFPKKSSCYETLVIIRMDRGFSVQITNLHKIFHEEVRVDTVTILGRYYSDVYKGQMGKNSQLIFSKQYGLIYLLLDNGDEASLIQ